MPRPRPPLPTQTPTTDRPSPEPQDALAATQPAAVAVEPDPPGDGLVSAGETLAESPGSTLAPEPDAEDQPVPAPPEGYGILTFPPALPSRHDDDHDTEYPFAREEPDIRAHLERIEEQPYGYLRGDAGTGKSYLASRYAEMATDGILLATTGIAAVNLGGTTINSTLRYYDTASMQLEFEYGRLGAALRQLASSGVRRLIVDEISMMDGNQLDILALALDDVNESRANNNLPPLGMWLTGDFAQLPPVGVGDKKPRPGQPKREGPPVIYAFQAKHWKRWGENAITLTTIRRQADADFIKAIQQVRTSDKTCVDYFRQFISQKEDTSFDGTSIMAKNDEVDRYNAIRMLRLDTPEHRYTAKRAGDPRAAPGEWKNIPDALTLKPGCLVMILANRRDPGSADMVYANGDLAIYKEQISTDHALVTLHRTGQDVVVNGVLREKLDPGIPRTERFKEVIDPKWIVASIDYMPLRVAYASTVHKSQGLSLDNVQVLINSQFWMSAGMLYVGLSRARSPQGLRIVGTVDQFAARIRTNPLIQEWL